MSRITRRTIIPVNQITPLTYRDGVTYIQMLTQLSEYIKGVLHPSLQHTVDQVVADVETQMDTHHDQYVDGVQEFQRIHDAFMSDVNAKLIALSDTAIADLVEDTGSRLAVVMREVFTDRASFDELEGDNQYFRERIALENQGFQHTVTEAVDGVKTSVDALDTEVDQRIETLTVDFDERIRELREALTLQSDPSMGGLLGAGRAMVVMVGSSTTTRNEFPAEFARHIHTQFHPGVFRTLEPSHWGGPESHLKWTEFPPGAHVINAAWGGSAGADYVDADRANRISALNPTMVTHSIGSNDWFHNRDPQDLVGQIQRVINMIHSNTRVWHVLVHQHERMDIRSSVQYEWSDYLDALHQVAQNNDNVIVVDGATPLRALGVGMGLQDPHQLMAEVTHLNTQGHRVLARVVARELGFATVSGGMDTGWKPVTEDSEHIKIQPGASSSANEPLMYRVIGSGTGFTTYIRGLVTRNQPAGERASFAEVTPKWRNALVPKTVFEPHDRHRIGTWHTTLRTPNTGGAVYMRQSSAMHALNHHGDMGSVGFFVDAVVCA